MPEQDKLTEEQKKKAMSQSLSEKEEDDPGIPKGIKGKFGNLDPSAVIINVIVALIVVFVMNNFIVPVPGMSKYKSDITRLENDLVAVRNVDSDIGKRVDLQESKISSALTESKTQIDAKLATSVTKSNLDTLQTSISDLNSRVSTLSAKPTTDSRVDTIITQLASINTDLSILKTSTSNLSSNADIKALQDKVIALDTAVKNLQVQQNNNNITVVAQTGNITLTNAIAGTIPVQITNSGNTALTVNIKAQLTTATSGIVISIASMNRNFNYLIANPNITFTTDVTVEANSTLTINPQVILTYTGTSPNLWNVAWSKN